MAGALLVSACAGGGSASGDGAAAGGMGSNGLASAMAGKWVVTGVYPSGITTLSAGQREALLGTVVLLSGTHAETIGGAQCEQPVYASRSGPLSSALAYRAAPAMADEVVIQTDVACQGAPFASFVLRQDGTLLSRYQGNWATLLAATPARVAAASAVAPAAPVAALAPAADGHGVAAHGMSAHGASAHGTSAHGAAGVPGLHLASYRSEGLAREGWGDLQKKFPELKALQVQYVPLILPEKGKFTRLIAVGAERPELANLCAKLSSAKQYCLLIDLAHGSEANPTASESGHKAVKSGKKVKAAAHAEH